MSSIGMTDELRAARTLPLPLGCEPRAARTQPLPMYIKIEKTRRVK